MPRRGVAGGVPLSVNPEVGGRNELAGQLWRENPVETSQHLRGIVGIGSDRLHGHLEHR